MGLWNGAAHLEEQLRSLAAQDHPGWRVIAADDGSTDTTRAVFADFAARFPALDLTLAEGPRRGPAANYLALLRALPDQPGWLAFCDQDDVWMPHKLGIALRALEPARDRVAMYCARYFITSHRLEGRRLSPARPRPPGFRNALVQNIASGHTQVLTPPAAALLVAAAREAAEVVVHDWWSYQIVTGAGGEVVHDDRPMLLYRQHGANHIGSNDGWRARLRRLGQVADGTFRRWNEVNLAALTASAHRLTPETRALLAEWQALRTTPGPVARLRGLRRLGLYRQGLAGTLALWFAALTGRL